MTSLLTYGEAADRLKLSKDFLRKLVSQRRIPYLKIGSAVRFDEADLAEWLASHRVNPGKERTR